MPADLAKGLGRLAARAAKLAAWSIGVAGWLLSVFWAGEIVTRAATPGTGVDAELAARMLGPWLALLACSVLLRKPSRWLEELGVRLGFLSGLGFFALALLGADVGFEDELDGALFVAAEFGLALFLLSAWLHWDQIVAARFRLRRFVNGVRPDGSQLDFMHGMAEPAGALCFLVAGLSGIFAPAAVNHGLSRMLNDYRREHIAALARHGLHPLPYHFAAIVVPQGVWIALTILSALAVYIAFRRVGGGSAGRGLAIWLLAIAEGVAAMAALLLFLGQLQASDFTYRFEAAAFAIAAAAFCWFCHRQRNRFLGGREGW